MFTDKRRDQILTALRTGIAKEQAARLGGVSGTTFFKWIRLGEEDIANGHTRTALAQFVQDAERARDLLEAELIAAVRRGARDRQVGDELVPGDWRAAMALAKSLWPERYAEGRDLARLMERRLALEERTQERIVLAAEAMLAVIAAAVDIPPELRQRAVLTFGERLRVLEAGGDHVAE